MSGFGFTASRLVLYVAMTRGTAGTFHRAPASSSTLKQQRCIKGASPHFSAWAKPHSLAEKSLPASSKAHRFSELRRPIPAAYKHTTATSRPR